MDARSNEPGRLFRPAARRKVLAALREVSSQLRLTVYRWNTDGRVWDQPKDWTDSEGKVRTNIVARKRRPDEYPENQRDAWVRLANDMNDLQSWANSIRDSALDAIDQIDRAERTRQEEGARTWHTRQ